MRVVALRCSVCVLCSLCLIVHDLTRRSSAAMTCMSGIVRGRWFRANICARMCHRMHIFPHQRHIFPSQNEHPLPSRQFEWERGYIERFGIIYNDYGLGSDPNGPIKQADTRPNHSYSHTPPHTHVPPPSHTRSYTSYTHTQTRSLTPRRTHTHTHAPSHTQNQPTTNQRRYPKFSSCFLKHLWTSNELSDPASLSECSDKSTPPPSLTGWFFI